MKAFRQSGDAWKARQREIASGEMASGGQDRDDVRCAHHVLIPPDADGRGQRADSDSEGRGQRQSRTLRDKYSTGTQRPWSVFPRSAMRSLCPAVVLCRCCHGVCCSGMLDTPTTSARESGRSGRGGRASQELSSVDSEGARCVQWRIWAWAWAGNEFAKFNLCQCLVVRLSRCVSV
jgi:hypothetical protein